MADKILLLDGAFLIHRANIKFRPSKTPTANPPNTEYVLVYNFFRSLKTLVNEFQPDKVFFVLEGKPNFRYQLLPEYKANRLIKTASSSQSNHREEVMKHFPEIVQLLGHLPITLVRHPEFEADDVINTLAENMRNEIITIISADSDYIQLLDRNFPQLRVYNPIKKEYREKTSYSYLYWKSLSGDASDNIQGLVSKSKAEYLLTHPDALKEFISIEENRARFMTNTKLIEFRIVPLEELEVNDGAENFPALKDEFVRMDFHSLVEEKSWQSFCSVFANLKL